MEFTLESQSTIKMEKGYYQTRIVLFVFTLNKSQSTIKMEKGYYTYHLKVTVMVLFGRNPQ